MYTEMIALLILGVAGTAYGDCGRGMAHTNVTFAELQAGFDLIGGHRIRMTELENVCNFTEDGQDEPIGLGLGLAPGGSVTKWKGLGWYHKTQEQGLLDRRLLEIRERQLGLTMYMPRSELATGDLIFETYYLIWETVETWFCFVDAYDTLQPGKRYHFSWETDQ